MSTARRLAGLVLAVAASAPAAGGGGGAAAGVGAEQDVREKVTLWGNDRVADVLKKSPDKVPGTYPEVEKLFGIGRACARQDSKEIFVVEEPSSRATGEQESTSQVLPRAVITGCNTDRQDPESVRQSFSLMVALVSSPDAPHAAEGDPMVLEPVEVMALDTKTGLYNFYVFESNGSGKPGTVTRIMRDATDRVLELEKLPGKAATKRVSEDRRCFNCHVAGGPLMNEMTEPWTNWVSTHKMLPEESSLTGETASIVTEAAALHGEHSRSSLANDLEQTMRAAIRTWVYGASDAAGSGFGQMMLDGTQPGGMPQMLRSVFCQTELGFMSSSDTVPLELFVDPAAVSGAGFVKPTAYPSEPFELLPVRSEMDKRIEAFLQKTGYLTARTITAIRLVDDENDIFSSARCALHAEAVEGLPAAPADVDAHLRKLLLAKHAAGALPAMSAPRSAYLAALLDGAIPDASLAKPRAAYFAEAKLRFEKATAQLTTSKGRAKLAARLDARQMAAHEMFPDSANPLPVLD